MRYHKRLLMHANALVRKYVFCSRRFAAWVFGVRVVVPPTVQSYCEWPTILLRAVAGRYVTSDSRVLEVGCGARNSRDQHPAPMEARLRAGNRYCAGESRVRAADDRRQRRAG